MGPKESLRQGSARRAVVLYDKIRNGGKVCATCTGCEGSETVVRCAIGTAESFKLKVGLHQVSALSPFLFADRLTDEVRREPPWTMMCADDIVICKETREDVERKLECWRYALERRGMKVIRSKTEYLCVNGGNDEETVKVEDTKMPRVKKFKFWE